MIEVTSQKNSPFRILSFCNNVIEKLVQLLGNVRFGGAYAVIQKTFPLTPLTVLTVASTSCPSGFVRANCLKLDELSL